jgi:hypothetical protein
MWQRLEGLKKSSHFIVVDKVTRDKGRIMGVVPSGDRRKVDIYLTLMTSNPMSINPSATSSAGVFRGRWRITVLRGLSDLG